MFQLTQEEFINLKSQILTLSWAGMRRSTPYAFTEQRVAMLPVVLRSKRDVQVHIEIMRIYRTLSKKELATGAKIGYY